jgi:large subunit ribosomal protein L4
MNKKEKRTALKSALTSKVQSSRLIVLDELTLDEIKTKKIVELVNNLHAEKALIVLKEKDDKVMLSARNVPDVETALTNTINVYDVLNAGTVVLTKDAVKMIEEVYA